MTSSDAVYQMLKDVPEFNTLSMDRQGEICLDVASFIKVQLRPSGGEGDVLSRLTKKLSEAQDKFDRILLRDGRCPTCDGKVEKLKTIDGVLENKADRTFCAKCNKTFLINELGGIDIKLGSHID